MVVGDLHCDLPYKMYKSGKTLDNNDFNWSLSHLKENDSFIQVFATCVEDDEKLNSFDGAVKVINNFKKELAKFGFNTTELYFEESKVNSVLSLEGGGALGGKISNVQKMYDLGVRIITLTWNYENELGYGAVTGKTDGLKPFGKEVVKEMNRLRMVVDVSHLNEAGFYDVAEFAGIPFIASHSNSKSICDNLRNLTDHQFLEIVKRGGLVGINTYPYFLNNTDKSDVCDIIKHLEHFLSLGGENVVSLGADFDGIDAVTSDFENISGYSNLMKELVKLNYSESLIAKIYYKNMKNYFNRYIF
ncbi:MAG: membrane dipeptidase [Clostridia bacterium]|nr:membrane dipeptidase [Clostridia bacterium]